MIKQYSQGKQVLIFCLSKKAAETLAFNLIGKIGAQPNHNFRMSNSLDQNYSFQDPNLEKLVTNRIAYHHASLPYDDRAYIEGLYLNGNILVLVSTSTLAFGVNLPAHLVIIKGTNQWRGTNKGYEKLSKSIVLQMVGRAGRVGYDTSGYAIIMTSSEDKGYYDFVEKNEMEVVESTLQNMIVEGIHFITIFL